MIIANGVMNTRRLSRVSVSPFETLKRSYIPMAPITVLHSQDCCRLPTVNSVAFT